VRFHNATPDVTLEGRLYASVRRSPTAAPGTKASYTDWARKPVTTGHLVGEYKPDVSLTLVAFDEY
jgi:peptide/nickel transport system substrate-binding protein